MLDPEKVILTSGDVVDARAGAKARVLAEAERAGLPVPPWFVVLAEPSALMAESRARALVSAGGVECEPALRSADPGARLRDELDGSIRRLCPGGELVAVRSSAPDEDGCQHSFAGQLETFLHVGPADVLEKVRAVWRSGSAGRVLAYRRQRGLQTPAVPAAAIVQRMVRARAAGVAFSADPVSGRRAMAIVCGVHGLGSALVAGEVDADTWHVDRRGAIVERRIACKRRMHVADVCAPWGVRGADAPAALAERPCLSDTEILAVADLARRAARQFGRPQDIEWAYEDDRLLLLQSRPITSLESLPDPDGALAIWDNSNIVESYNGITTPLTFSFAREVYEHVYRQFCRLVRVPVSDILEQDDAFGNLLGLVRGRLYYNLLNWYRVLALFPGFALNRPFMEQMMGVSEPLPAGLVEGISQKTSRGRWADAVRLTRTIAGLIASHFTIERRIAGFYQRLDHALAPPDPPLAARRPDELVAHYRELRGRLLLSWDAPLVNDFFAMVFYGLLREAAKTWCGDRDGTLQNDLIAGEGAMISAEPALRIQQLARRVAGVPGLADRLVSGSVPEIERAIRQVPELQAEIEAYLDRFGDRTVNELKLESHTLHDDPLPLFRSIGTLAARIADGADGGERQTSGDRLRLRAKQHVDAALAGRPVRRLAFAWIVRQARARVRDRENLRFERTRLFGRIRRIFVEMGRHFHAQNLLDDPRDIFYLEIGEVLAFVEGRATTTNLRALARLRRDEFRGFESQPAPDSRFETRGVVYHGHDFRQAALPAPLDGHHRRGIGCSPGLVRGPVRIVRDPRLVDLRARAILVAEHTDPGWILVFPSALGVLVERGSLLSHAAIVARELGIPAVVSIPGLTSWLRDGDWIELDGTTGVVRRVESPGGAGFRDGE